MAAGTLFTYPNSFRANKALVAAQFSGADVKVDGSFKLGETNKSADFLKKFPLGKVPSFQGKDGFCLSESNAIAYYVANSQLKGTDEKQQALVQQWISFSDNEILPAACTWTFPCQGITQYNKQDTERAKKQIETVFSMLNTHLLTKTYLVGERVTLADISMVCNLQSLYELVLDPSFRKPFGNVNRWFTTLINQPQFKKVLGTVTLASKMAVFDAKKYQELHGASGDKKKETKKEKAPAKAAEKPKAAPKEEEAPKPKGNTDPLAELPEGKMSLDEWKKVYSNQDTETKALPFFWENFDKEAMSIWLGEYTEDLSDLRVFMCSNLVGGMMQRLDKLFKHAFGSICILADKDGKDLAISGVWFWKGQQNAFDLKEDWNVDAPSYKWTKLEFDDPKTKAIVDKHFLQDGKFGTREVADAKNFK